MRVPTAVTALLVLAGASTTANAAAHWGGFGSCTPAHYGEYRPMPGKTDDCGGQAYAWCAPKGAPLLQVHCGSPARALAAVMAAYRAQQQRAVAAKAEAKAAYRAQQERAMAAKAEAKTRREEAAAAKITAQQTSKVADLSSVRAQQSGSCSDITGVGGGPGPSTCAPANGLAPNAQAQIDQAKASLQAAKTVKQSDPSYTGWSTAAAQFRKAAAAFQAAGDQVEAAAAADQAQTLEDALKIANERSGSAPSAVGRAPQVASTTVPAQAATADLCDTLHSNADQCYRRAIDIGKIPGGGPIPVSGQSGAFVECVKVYCSAMLKAKCSMPIFGTKRSLGYCFTLTTDDADFVRESSLACPVGKHLFLAPDADEPICQDNANGSAEPQAGPNSTITGVN